jgi:hypothetical protein
MPSITRNSLARIRTVAAIALSIAAVGLAAAPASAGPIGFQASGGWYTDNIDEAFLGVGARVGAASLSVIPNVEWLFVDSGSIYTVNVDGTIPIFPLGVASIYAGGGVGLFITDPEAGDSNTDTVVNLLAGAGFNAIALKPFGQIKWVLVDGNDPLVFSLGIRF